MVSLLVSCCSFSALLPVLLICISLLNFSCWIAVVLVVWLFFGGGSEEIELVYGIFLVWFVFVFFPFFSFVLSVTSLCHDSKK